MRDEPSKGQPTGWTPQTELEHFMQCPVCGEWFDMRDPENIGKHWHDGPFPLRSAPIIAWSTFYE